MHQRHNEGADPYSQYREEVSQQNQRIAEEMHRRRVHYGEDTNQADEPIESAHFATSPQHRWQSTERAKWLQKWGLKTEEVAFTAFDLDTSCTLKDVKTRYRELVKTSHPDVGGDAAKFKEITAVQAALTDRFHILESLSEESGGPVESGVEHQQDSYSERYPSRGKQRTETSYQKGMRLKRAQYRQELREESAMQSPKLQLVSAVLSMVLGTLAVWFIYEMTFNSWRKKSSNRPQGGYQ